MRRRIGALLLGICALSGATAVHAAQDGALTLTLENDFFTGSDNNYTNGLGITWVSGAVRSDDRSWVGRWTRGWSFLPFVGDERYTVHASWALAQELNTPDNVRQAQPAADDQPYSGILSLDSILYARKPDWTHAWQIKLGVVGPAARGELVQRKVHRLTGSEQALGWHTQLPNEPIVNLGYSVAHRAAGGRVGADAQWRLVPLATVGVGNYFTGAGLGMYGEVGWNLVDALGVSALRSGLNAASTVGVGPMDRWSVSFFGGVGAYAVGRYLPLDGTLFRTSRSVDAARHVGMSSAGLCVRHGDWTLSLVWTRFPRMFNSERQATDFGTMSLAWLL